MSNIQIWTDLTQLKTPTYSLPLMKISAYHKAKGDDVQWHTPLIPCDKLYCSKVFSAEWTKDNEYTQNAEETIRGGTGHDNTITLPIDIEHIYPDYSLYAQLRERAVGFLTRGCPNSCEFCIVSDKEGRRSEQVADLSEFCRGQKNITLLDPNILACKDRDRLLAELASTKATIEFQQGLDARFIDLDVANRLKQIKMKQMYFAWDLERGSEQKQRGLLNVREVFREKNPRDLIVYVLVNFDTDFEFDLFRILWLVKNGFDPYIMLYEKWNASGKYRHL